MNRFPYKVGISFHETFESAVRAAEAQASEELRDVTIDDVPIYKDGTVVAVVVPGVPHTLKTV